MKKYTLNNKEDLSLVRFEAVCHVKSLKQEGLPLAECLRQAASRTWPDEQGTYYSCRTIETWWYAYHKGGYIALIGDRRCDDSVSRSIDEPTGLWLIGQIKNHPGVPLTVIVRNANSKAETLPSMSSIYRYLKHHGYDRRSLRAGRLENGPKKAFEAPAPNDLWMVDFSDGPFITIGKISVKTHLCLIIDDYSRLIPFGAYFLAANTESFLYTFKEAIVRRGPPDKLYADNGGPFINHHVRQVCANIGTRLINAKPYHCFSKGKVERLLRTVQMDFEASLTLNNARFNSIEELNAALSHWIANIYHMRVHSSTGMTPHQRFNSGKYPLRMIEDPASIDPLFYTRLERSVRKDGTVKISNKLFEVDLAFRGLKIQLRFDPFEMSRIEVWHNNSFCGFAKRADLHLNSQIPYIA
jgi:transposase InsO family protein